MSPSRTGETVLNKLGKTVKQRMTEQERESESKENNSPWDLSDRFGPSENSRGEGDDDDERWILLLANCCGQESSEFAWMLSWVSCVDEHGCPDRRIYEGILGKR